MEEWTLNEVNQTLIHSLQHTNSENAMIHVPVREIILSSSSEIKNGNPVRMASLLFRNMSGLLPERLREDTNMINSRSAQKITVMQSLTEGIYIMFTHAEHYYHNVLLLLTARSIACMY